MRVITLDENNTVVGVKDVGETCILTNNEMVSNIGEQGQVRQVDGTFIDAPIEPITPQPTQPTNSEIAQMISDLQADLIIAGVI